MGNQPLGDSRPQMPQHGNVTVVSSAQHSEKSFQRKKWSFWFAGEYKVQIEV